MIFKELRQAYHEELGSKIVRICTPKKAQMKYPNFADASNPNSIKIAWGVVRRLGLQPKDFDEGEKLNAGTLFETATRAFLEKSFERLQHLRPGQWKYSTQLNIATFDQYAHLASLKELIAKAKKQDKKAGAELEQLIGQDYIIKPDIVIGRRPVSDTEINMHEDLIGSTGDTIAQYTALRAANRKASSMILHASISCKWTVRSDRSQNTRTEALNLIRNRKGALPHIVAVTMEPLPMRIQSLAYGAGDMDCIYHVALPELQDAIFNPETDEDRASLSDQQEVLSSLIDGRRLRDITDLPFDLAA